MRLSLCAAQHITLPLETCLQDKPKLPFLLGKEASGIVTAVGAKVTGKATHSPLKLSFKLTRTSPSCRFCWEKKPLASSPQSAPR